MDPEFQEKAKAVLDPDYELQSGNDIHQLVKNAMSQSDEDRAYLIQLRLKHGLSGEIRGEVGSPRGKPELPMAWRGLEFGQPPRFFCGRHLKETHGDLNE